MKVQIFHQSDGQYIATRETADGTEVCGGPGWTFAAVEAEVEENYPEAKIEYLPEEGTND